MTDTDVTPGDDTNHRETVAWRFSYCTEQVGTFGDEPGECPTCGNSDGWDRIVSRSGGANSDE